MSRIAEYYMDKQYKQVENMAMLLAEHTNYDYEYLKSYGKELVEAFWCDELEQKPTNDGDWEKALLHYVTITLEEDWPIEI